jgi:hypothetical protein
MYSKPDTTKRTGWRKTLVGAALVGIACVAVGTQVFESYEEEDIQSKINLFEQYSHPLIAHGEYVAEQGNTIGTLVKEGAQTMYDT